MDNAAYLHSQITCAMLEAMGMQAENEQRRTNGLSITYTEKDFVALIDKYGLGHNSVVTLLNNQ